MKILDRNQYQYPWEDYIMIEESDKASDYSTQWMYRFEFQDKDWKDIRYPYDNNNFGRAVHCKREVSYTGIMFNMVEHKDEALRHLRCYNEMRNNIFDNQISLLESAKEISYINGELNSCYNRSYYIVIDSIAYKFAQDWYTVDTPRHITSCVFEKVDEVF